MLASFPTSRLTRVNGNVSVRSSQLGVTLTRIKLSPFLPNRRGAGTAALVRGKLSEDTFMFQCVSRSRLVGWCWRTGTRLDRSGFIRTH